MNSELFETFCVISVINARGVLMVSKFERKVSKLVLKLDNYDFDDDVMDYGLNEQEFISLQQIFIDGKKCSDCMSFDECDIVYGRNQDCLNDMIEVLEKTFVDLYKMKDEFVLIKNKLLSIEWGDSLIDIG